MATEARVAAAEDQQGVVAGACARKVQIVCGISLIALAVVRSWFTRYEFMGGDSVAYLDIAREIAEGHPGAAVHAYWSPGYPVLVSFFLWMFHPNVYWEAPLVHFVNVLIFIAALGSFQLFWGEVWRLHVRGAETGDTNIPDDALWSMGYAAFGIATLNEIRVGLIGPDLLVAAFCFLAGWSALRVRRTPAIWGAILLGVLLGLGYYAKAPFFPMGIVFFLCACFRWPFSRRIVLIGTTALATFVLVSAPFVILLSRAKARLTFGDSARLSSAFYIDGVQFYQHWQGGPPGSGMPVHPTRKLSDYPEIYEFAARNMGTYPAWFDATYWYEGITPHFKLRRQTIVLVRNLALQVQFIMQSGAALVCIAIILALLTGYRDRWIRRFGQQWPVWMPGAIALLMYAVIHVEERFLGGWLVMLFAGTICACRLPSDSGTRRAVRCIGVAVLITAAGAVILQASREAVGIEYAASRSSRNAAIAVFLLNHGLHPGDDVALIGNGTEAYWAHLARLRLVAEIPAGITSRAGHPALDFWESRAEQQQRALEILRRTGARAVIAGSQESLAASVPSFVPPPWKKIDGTGAYVYFFPPSE